MLGFDHCNSDFLLTFSLDKAMESLCLTYVVMVVTNSRLQTNDKFSLIIDFKIGVKSISALGYEENESSFIIGGELIPVHSK